MRAIPTGVTSQSLAALVGAAMHLRRIQRPTLVQS